jgi:hypothetical protein
MKLSNIEALALAIVLTAPAKRSAYANGCVIPWDLIEELRQRFEKQGIDLAKARAVYHKEIAA